MRAVDFLRPAVRALPVYELPRRRDGMLLDANELPIPRAGMLADLNRYPDPDAGGLAAAFARVCGVDAAQVLPTRGSDDAIDALGRACLEPGRDAVIVVPPTFTMYGVFARLQGANVIEVPLADGFRYDVAAIAGAWRPGVKLVYVCSPNNPTGTTLAPDALDALCTALAGRAVVVVDEAYQEFSAQPSAVPALARHENLVVLRTLSKAYGLAGLRCGALLGAPTFVQAVRRVLPPYPLPTPVISAALAALTPDAVAEVERIAGEIRDRRDRFATALEASPSVAAVTRGEGNFVLVQGPSERLEAAGIRVRRFDGALSGWFRITVGTEAEVARAQAALR